MINKQILTGIGISSAIVLIKHQINLLSEAWYNVVKVSLLTKTLEFFLTFKNTLIT